MRRRKSAFLSGMALLCVVAIAVPQAYAGARPGAAVKKAADKKKAQDKQREKAAGGGKSTRPGRQEATGGGEGNAFRRQPAAAASGGSERPAKRAAAAGNSSTTKARKPALKPTKRRATRPTVRPRPRVAARSSSPRSRAQDAEMAAAGYGGAEFDPRVQALDEGYGPANQFGPEDTGEGRPRGFSEGMKKLGKVLGMGALSVVIGIGLAAGFAGVGAAAPIAAVIGIPAVLFAIGAGQIISKPSEPNMQGMQGLTPQQQYRVLANQQNAAELGNLPGQGMELNGAPGGLGN